MEENLKALKDIAARKNKRLNQEDDSDKSHSDESSEPIRVRDSFNFDYNPDYDPDDPEYFDE